MKVSSILSYMGIEFVLLGDTDYHDQIDLKTLNLKLNTPVDNDLFHQKAQEFITVQENNLYKKQRQAEYPPISDLIVALWEMVVEDRPETVNELQQLRVAIKNKYPKPN